mmetsp:Transcript_3935/g.9193  ORF Transcript_3935/g.9193 Transcript_3935/m.9193 type:complete len:93 (+) Transcript_3935:357-635(+)
MWTTSQARDAAPLSVSQCNDEGCSNEERNLLGTYGFVGCLAFARSEAGWNDNGLCCARIDAGRALELIVVSQRSALAAALVDCKLARRPDRN